MALYWRRNSTGVWHSWSRRGSCRRCFRISEKNMFPTHGIGLQLFQRLFGNKIRQIFALGIHLIKKYGTGRRELISQLLLYLVCGLHLPGSNSSSYQHQYENNHFFPPHSLSCGRSQRNTLRKWIVLKVN